MLLTATFFRGRDVGVKSTISMSVPVYLGPPGVMVLSVAVDALLRHVINVTSRRESLVNTSESAGLGRGSSKLYSQSVRSSSQVKPPINAYKKAWRCSNPLSCECVFLNLDKQGYGKQSS